jgi:hypothetical protein
MRSLHAALAPYDFTREDGSLVRVKGDLRAKVSYYLNRTLGVTPEWEIKDLRTEELFLKIFPRWPEIPVEVHRIGAFSKSLTPWWDKDDLEGPAQMAAAVIEHVIPWFERAWPLEAQAREWHYREGALESRGYGGHNFVCLILTLHRMGEFEEVRALLNKPVPRTAIQSSVEMVAKVRDHLGYA